MIPYGIKKLVSENGWSARRHFLNFKKNSSKCVPQGVIDNLSTLFQIMAWRQIGDKPWFDPLMTQFMDKHIRHQTSMGLTECGHYSDWPKNIFQHLTHWGRVVHICVSKLTIIGSDNGLSEAIIWTNDGILWIGPLGTNFSEIVIEVYTFSFKKMDLKILLRKWCPFCLGLNVLKVLISLGTMSSHIKLCVRGVTLLRVWVQSYYSVPVYGGIGTYTYQWGCLGHI